jgi:hypothetical protein
LRNKRLFFWGAVLLNLCLLFFLLEFHINKGQLQAQSESKTGAWTMLTAVYGGNRQALCVIDGETQRMVVYRYRGRGELEIIAQRDINADFRRFYSEGGRY